MHILKYKLQSSPHRLSLKKKSRYFFSNIQTARKKGLFKKQRKKAMIVDRINIRIQDRCW